MNLYNPIYYCYPARVCIHCLELVGFGFQTIIIFASRQTPHHTTPHIIMTETTTTLLSSFVTIVTAPVLFVWNDEKIWDSLTLPLWFMITLCAAHFTLARLFFVAASKTYAHASIYESVRGSRMLSAVAFALSATLMSMQTLFAIAVAYGDGDKDENSGGGGGGGFIAFVSTVMDVLYYFGVRTAILSSFLFPYIVWIGMMVKRVRTMVFRSSGSSNDDNAALMKHLQYMQKQQQSQSSSSPVITLEGLANAFQQQQQEERSSSSSSSSGEEEEEEQEQEQKESKKTI